MLQIVYAGISHMGSGQIESWLCGNLSDEVVVFIEKDWIITE